MMRVNDGNKIVKFIAKLKIASCFMRKVLVLGRVMCSMEVAQLCINELVTSAFLVSEERKIGITMSEFLFTESC